VKRLDLYVGKIVLGAFAASLLFFLFLSVLVDLLNSLPRYAERAADEGLGGLELAAYLGLYYAKLLPVLVTTVTPFATVIAGMFSVARLHGANEVVPMLFVGRSIHRVLAPMLWCGAFGAILMVSSWQWVVPHVGSALATNETFLRQGSAMQEFLVHESHGSFSKYMYVRAYDPTEQRMHDVRLLIQGELADDATLVTAELGTWDEERGDWLLEGGRSDRADGGRPQRWLDRPDVTPEVLLQQSRESVDPETMSYTDLVKLIELRPNRADVRLALHRHITYPLANILLLLLALPMAVRYERGSRVDRLLAAIAMCAGYFLLDLACQRLGTREWLHPIVAAWTPTIVFGSLGVVLFSSTRS
jgi:lipopolysaccharide export system permease protein